MFGKKSGKNRKNKNVAHTFYADNINPAKDNILCNGNDQSQPVYDSCNGFYRTSTVSYPISSVNTRIPGSESSSRTASSASSYSNHNINRRRPNSAYFENTSVNIQTDNWVKSSDHKKQKSSKRNTGIFSFFKKLGRKDHTNNNNFYNITDSNNRIVRTSTGNFNHQYIPRGEAILQKRYKSSSTLCEDDFSKMNLDETAEKRTVFTDSVENISILTENDSIVSVNEFITEEIAQRSSSHSLNCTLESVPESECTPTARINNHEIKSFEETPAKDASFRPSSTHFPKIVLCNQPSGPYSKPSSLSSHIYKSTPRLDLMETPSPYRNRVDTPIKRAISRPGVLDGVKLRRKPKNYQTQKEKHRSLNMDDRSIKEELFRRSFILEDLIGGKMDEEQLSRGLSRISQVMRNRDVCKDEVEQILLMDEDEFLNYSLQCSPSVIQVTS